MRKIKSAGFNNHRAHAGYGGPGRLARRVTQMKLFAVTMIRNEMDILPSFLRHILAFFDGGHLLDHRSTDGSTELLKSFCSQHPQWTYTYLNFPGFFQSDACMFFVAEAFKGDVDAVVLLDADEFVVGPRSEFERRFAAEVPANEVGLLRWRNCLPRSFDAPFDISDPLWIRQTNSALGKVVITREFFQQAGPDVTPFAGNHWIWLSDGSRAPMREFAELYHVPVRSKRQATLKGITKVLGYLARGVDDRDAGTHNFELVDLAAADRLSDDELVSFVNAYGLRAEQRPSITWQNLAGSGFAVAVPQVELSESSKVRHNGGIRSNNSTQPQDITAILAGWGLDDAGPPFTLENGQLSSSSAQPRFRGTRAQQQNTVLRAENANLRDENSGLRDENARLRDQDANLKDENAALRDRQGHAQDKTIAVNRRNEELAQELRAADDLLNNMRKEIAQLKTSRSWRLTRPLRQLMDMWRGTPRDARD